MCGRYTLYDAPHKLKDLFGTGNLPNFGARYNAAPLQEMPVIVKNKMGIARWGFLPPWAHTDDHGLCAKMINARSETVADKPSFIESWQKGRRCLIPANGYYEWQKDETSKQKQPYYITSSRHDCFAFAGLWSKHNDLVTFTILTKEADPAIAHLHHRMPIMLSPDEKEDWFTANTEGAAAIIQSAHGKDLVFHPVSDDVGKVTNDSEALIAPVTIMQQQTMF